LIGEYVDCHIPSEAVEASIETSAYFSVESPIQPKSETTTTPKASLKTPLAKSNPFKKKKSKAIVYQDDNSDDDFV
jgi:hypothetical protein